MLKRQMSLEEIASRIEAIEFAIGPVEVPEIEGIECQLYELRCQVKRLVGRKASDEDALDEAEGEAARTKAPTAVISGPWLVYQLTCARGALPADPESVRVDGYLTEILNALYPLVNFDRNLGVTRD